MKSALVSPFRIGGEDLDSAFTNCKTIRERFSRGGDSEGESGGLGVRFQVDLVGQDVSGGD
jgi:hypothetical protein